MDGIHYVIRKDGTVPFDPGFHPDHQKHLAGHFTLMGHAVEMLPDWSGLKLLNFTPERHAELEKAHHERLAKQA